ncbi:MAG: hypothetical protein SO183_07345 [Fusobacterium mortiferum]|uniref:hypothetical protein n=1 Tax=Fusobacterium mortiferum TaxID=850 RepID=UPI00158B8B8C|nr:hypothetical protein [Fusobacterium mortiferum]MDY4801433.1 hypothetical protein [Fusobacterium mortiferum]
MSKLMEIIDKSPDFKNGTCSFKFLDTTFNQLTRKIGSKEGASFTTAKARDILSKELLQTLNTKQIVLKDKVLKWQDEINKWVTNKNTNKNINANLMNYIFTSVVDYTSKYIPGETLADYYLLSEVVSAEKELYEFTSYYTTQYIIYLQNILKEWSKDKLYFSCIKKVYGTVYFNFDIEEWKLTDAAGLVTTTEGGGKARTIRVSGFENMKLGEHKRVTYYAYYSTSSNPQVIYKGYVYFNIKRTALGSQKDDGKFDFWLSSWAGKGLVSHYSEMKVEEYTGKHSPHFDAEPKDLNINWVKTRVLL